MNNDSVSFKIEINITPMSMKNGVMGLPIECCREWDASQSVRGKLIYADRTSDITFSPKHKDETMHRASAWQFTINDSVQFSQLKMDGVYTYVEEKVSGEKLVCDFYKQDDNYIVKVIDVVNNTETKATKKVRELLKQGIRVTSDKESEAPLWNSPSEWVSFKRIDEYAEVTDCLYIWQGMKEGVGTQYLYVGIVGDNKLQGKSKRNLAQRLREEQKKYYQEEAININQFRYCSLNNAQGFPIPELLKTVEMSEITLMSSLFKCENARDNIDALFEGLDIVLLNKMTSYKYVK